MIDATPSGRPVPTRPKTAVDLTPPGRAVVVLASLALGAAWTTGSEPARIAACLLLAPLLVDWAAKLRLMDGIGIGVGRRRTRAGAAHLEKIVLSNQRRTLWNVQFAAHGLLASPRAHPALIEQLPAGGRLEVELPLRAGRRGVATSRTFVLATRHPLGLVRVVTRIPVAAVVIAEPARLPHVPTGSATGSDGELDSERSRRSDGETFFALRELRDGDDWTRVHALRSAALGQPVRVVHHGTLSRAARVLLDLRAPPGRSPSRYAGEAFEWAMSAAATLIENLTRGGRTVDVAVLGRGPGRFDDLGGRTPPAEFYDFLAAAQPRSHQPAPDAVLDWLAAGEGSVFWIVAGGFAAALERERLGRPVRLLEWAA